jgi:hypothetical protein
MGVREQLPPFDSATENTSKHKALYSMVCSKFQIEDANSSKIKLCKYVNINKTTEVHVP